MSQLHSDSYFIACIAKYSNHSVSSSSSSSSSPPPPPPPSSSSLPVIFKRARIPQSV
jgi:hypothetical protein